MRNRIRIVGSVVSLLAFSAFFAESVRAAACGPEPGAMVHAAPTADGHRHSAANGTSHAEGSSTSAPDEPAPQDPAPRCPLAAGSAGACMSLTLLVPSDAVEIMPGESALKTCLVEPHSDLLVATSLFHPPRA